MFPVPVRGEVETEVAARQAFWPLSLSFTSQGRHSAGTEVVARLSAAEKFSMTFGADSPTRPRHLGVLGNFSRIRAELGRPADNALRAMFEEHVAPAIRTYRQTWP